MVKIVWAYCPDDRDKQGTTEDVPKDVARAYVHEGLARYAPEQAETVEQAQDSEPEVQVAPAESETAPAESQPAPKRTRSGAVPEQGKPSADS